MDRLRELLDQIKRDGHARGNFLGLLNILIGHRIESDKGELISQGLTWRSLAVLLKKVRWDKEAAAELGLTSAALPPRDRERFWYQVIAQAGVDSPRAAEAGARIAARLQEHGYRIGGTKALGGVGLAERQITN